MKVTKGTENLRNYPRLNKIRWIGLQNKKSDIGFWFRSWTQKKDLSGKTGKIWIRLVNSIQSMLTSWFSIIVLWLCEMLAINVVGWRVYMKAPYYPYHSSVSQKSFPTERKRIWPQTVIFYWIFFSYYYHLMVAGRLKWDTLCKVLSLGLGTKKKKSDQ